jgi:hypothetical protein
MVFVSRFYLFQSAPANSSHAASHGSMALEAMVAPSGTDAAITDEMAKKNKSTHNETANFGKQLLPLIINLLENFSSVGP